MTDTSSAAPYEINDKWAKPGQGGEFWELVSVLDPNYFPPTPAEDTLDDDEGYTFEVPAGVIGNGRRKTPEQSDIDLHRQWLNEFVNSYAEHRAILDRAHATARALLAEPPYA